MKRGSGHAPHLDQLPQHATSDGAAVPLDVSLAASAASESALPDTRQPATDAASSIDNPEERTRPTGTSSSTAASNSTAQKPTTPVAKYLIPVFLAAAALTWLLRKARNSTEGSSSSGSGSRHHASKHRQQRASAASPVEPAVPEVPEPESTLAMYASTFQLRTEDLAARPAALDGLTCVVAEHIPIQVRRQHFDYHHNHHEICTPAQEALHILARCDGD